jgi:uncharacterized protein YbbC (DUF1343 family)
MIRFYFFKNTVLFPLVLVSFAINIGRAAILNPENIGLNQEPIITGAENYTRWLPILEGKKIGLVANQSSVLCNNLEKGQKNVHLVDFMLSKRISVTTIFAPEHGFRGTADAGEYIKDGRDLKTNLPIVSLYGSNKKPKPEHLKNIDVMVFDLQDVGVRFYTYISSLHYVMEACAEVKIPLIILDRPNPNGAIIDGPVLEPEDFSFVGMHPIPVLHGLTIGEYAQMINGEGWLQNRIKCPLTVIPCLHYQKNMRYVLPVKPSPNLPNAKAVNLYASLCFFEGTNISVGRGTSKQFQIYGAPFLPNTGFSFVPEPNEGAKAPLHNGVTCYGKDLSQIPDFTQLEIGYLLKAYFLTHEKTGFFNDFFTKLAGSKMQEQIESGATENEIRKSWEPALSEYKVLRKKYELY